MSLVEGSTPSPPGPMLLGLYRGGGEGAHQRGQPKSPCLCRVPANWPLTQTPASMPHVGQPSIFSCQVGLFYSAAEPTSHLVYCKQLVCLVAQVHDPQSSRTRSMPSSSCSKLGIILRASIGLKTVTPLIFLIKIILLRLTVSSLWALNMVAA
jgi:hypothetical protein